MSAEVEYSAFEEDGRLYLRAVRDVGTVGAIVEMQRPFAPRNPKADAETIEEAAAMAMNELLWIEENHERSEQLRAVEEQ